MSNEANHTTTEAANTTRAHVEGCTKALSVPVDLCECGGRVIVWTTGGRPCSPCGDGDTDQQFHRHAEAAEQNQSGQPADKPSRL